MDVCPSDCNSLSKECLNSANSHCDPFCCVAQPVNKILTRIPMDLNFLHKVPMNENPNPNPNMLLPCLIFIKKIYIFNSFTNSTISFKYAIYNTINIISNAFKSKFI